MRDALGNINTCMVTDYDVVLSPYFSSLLSCGDVTCVGVWGLVCVWWLCRADADPAGWQGALGELANGRPRPKRPAQACLACSPMGSTLRVTGTAERGSGDFSQPLRWFGLEFGPQHELEHMLGSCYSSS